MKFVFFLLVFSFLFFSCGKKQEKTVTFEEYIIQVDSISVADTVKLNKHFFAQFWGIVGEDNSYEFSRFIVKEDSLKTSLTLVGKHHLQKKSTDSTTVFLKDKTFKLQAKKAGKMKIEIVNPGYFKTIDRTIEVQE